MNVIRRIIAIVLQVVLGCYIGSMSAYFSWMPLSLISFLGSGILLLMGVIFGAVVTLALVFSIGVVFMFRGDWRYTVLGALVGVVLTVWASSFPLIKSLGYTQLLLLEAIPAILATGIFHITDQLRRRASKVKQPSIQPQI